MIRVVIDTNILFSGLISSSRHEALIILAIRQGLVQPCLSDAIVGEYKSVLARRKFSFPTDEIEALIAMLMSNGEVIWPAGSHVVSRDPADTKFIHCALDARADFIVTGNRRDFPQPFYGITRIVNARELLERITREI